MGNVYLVLNNAAWNNRVNYLWTKYAAMGQKGGEHLLDWFMLQVECNMCIQELLGLQEGANAMGANPVRQIYEKYNENTPLLNNHRSCCKFHHNSCHINDGLAG